MANKEIIKVGNVFGANLLDELFRADALLFGLEHNCRAMGVISTDIVTLVATHALETHPNVGLDMLE